MDKLNPLKRTLPALDDLSAFPALPGAKKKDVLVKPAPDKKVPEEKETDKKVAEKKVTSQSRPFYPVVVELDKDQNALRAIDTIEEFCGYELEYRTKFIEDFGEAVLHGFTTNEDMLAKCKELFLCPKIRFTKSTKTLEVGDTVHQFKTFNDAFDYLATNVVKIFCYGWDTPEFKIAGTTVRFDEKCAEEIDAREELYTGRVNHGHIDYINFMGSCYDLCALYSKQARNIAVYVVHGLKEE